MVYRAEGGAVGIGVRRVILRKVGCDELGCGGLYGSTKSFDLAGLQVVLVVLIDRASVLD